MNIQIFFSSLLIWFFFGVSMISFLISLFGKVIYQFKKYIVSVIILFIVYLIQINHPGKLSLSKINWLTMYFLLIILVAFIISVNEEIKEKKKENTEK
ncbi:MAG: hypothetical protein WCO35_00010 [Candidatus Nomurabacteria bacterium]